MYEALRAELKEVCKMYGGSYAEKEVSIRAFKACCDGAAIAAAAMMAAIIRNAGVPRDIDIRLDNFTIMRTDWKKEIHVRYGDYFMVFR